MQPLYGYQNKPQTPRSAAFVLLSRFWNGLLNFLYSLLGKHFVGKVFVSDRECTGCGNCSRRCPQRAIRMAASHPRWKLSCRGCQQCLQNCSEHAIKISLFRLFTFTVLVFLPYDEWVLPLFGKDFYLNKNFAAGQFAGLFIWGIGFVIACYLADKIIFVLERFSLFHRIAGFTYTRRSLKYNEVSIKKAVRDRKAVRNAKSVNAAHERTQVIKK